MGVDISSGSSFGLLSFGVYLFFVPNIVYANEINNSLMSSEDVVLEAIPVIGKRNYVGSVNGYVAEESTTASKTDATLLGTPQSVSVIGRKELDDRGVNTTTQALQYTPGVYASTGAIFQRYDAFSVRGFNSTSTGVLLDGLRSTTKQAWVTYPPYGMERIEILRGPNAFFYGSGSPGGVVNMIGKRPTEEAKHEVGIKYGSFDRMQGQFDFSGPLTTDKKFLYRIVGLERDSDTQYDMIQDNAAYLAPSITWNPHEDASLTVNASFTRTEFGPPRPYIPIYGTLLDNPNGKLPENTYLDGKDLNNNHSQFNLGYDFDYRFDDGWSFNSTSRYARNKLVTETLSGMGLQADKRTLNRMAFGFDITGKVFSTDNSVKMNWGDEKLRGVTVAGVSWRHSIENFNMNTGAMSTVDIFNPVYTTPFSATTPHTRKKQSAHELGAYVANTLTFNDRVILDLAARTDRAYVNTDDLRRGTSTSQDDSATTYRVGVSYLTDFGVAPYTSYTTTFEPQLGTNLDGEAYIPTEGWQFEAGVKYQPDDMDALFTAAWYHLVQENVLTSDPDRIGNNIQTGEITSRGIELSAKANLLPNLRVLANYSCNDLENTSTTDAAALGNVPIEQPVHSASLWGNYTFENGVFAGLGLGAGLRYVGHSYADAANTIKVPSATLLDASLHYDFGKKIKDLQGFKLVVNAGNLLDKQYYTSCTHTSRSQSCKEGFDRNINATLTYSW